MIRRHPILFGVLLFCLVGLLFTILMFGLGNLTGGKRHLTMTDKVGIVPVEGVISSSRSVVEQLEAFGKDDDVKAVVLRIESPGGGVAPSQEIFEAIQELKKKKKVVASMGSVAASGGYLIACATDRIVANAGTITGSISAIMHFANAEELMKKVGIKASAVKSGKYKDIGSPAREMTEEERIILQDLVDDIYDQFLDAVAANRRMTKDALKKIADGRVFTGRQAQKLGLVDSLGDQSYAVRLAAQMAGLKGKPDVIYPPKKKAGVIDFLLQEMHTALAASLSEKRSSLGGVNYLYSPGGGTL